MSSAARSGKRHRYSADQIAAALKRVDQGVGVRDVCRDAGIGQSTLYLWRKHRAEGQMAGVLAQPRRRRLNAGP